MPKQKFVRRLIGRFEALVGDERNGMVETEAELFVKNAGTDDETGDGQLELIQRECDSPNSTEMRSKLDEGDVEHLIERLQSLK